MIKTVWEKIEIVWKNIKIDWKALAIIVGLVIISAAAVGGSMWYARSKTVDYQQEQIEVLEEETSNLIVELKDAKDAKDAREAAAKAKAEAEALAAAQAAEKAARQAAYIASIAQSSTPEPEATPVPSPQIYFFYSPECGTSMAEKSIVDELVAEGYPFVYFDVKETPSYISQYGFSAVPTFILNGHMETAFFTKQELIDFWNTYK